MNKTLALISVILVSIFFISCTKISNGQNQKSNCQCISDALADIEKIKVGMKRKDLMEMFRTDGGISAINPERFVYEKCSFIKIEVKFEFIDKNNRFPKGNPEDKIVEISKPYVEHPFYD